ncbi:hypothetical protein ACF3M1_03230 [Luteimonas sp. WGS1318]
MSVVLGVIAGIGNSGFGIRKSIVRPVSRPSRHSVDFLVLWGTA